MFSSKLKTLEGFEKKTSDFVTTLVKKGVETRSGNNSLKYTTSGDPFADQFGNIGATIKPRSFAEVSKDMEVLWNHNPYYAICFIMYVRLITRKVQIDNDETKTVQKGAGLKSEGIMRMLWLAMYHREYFNDNLLLFVTVGSWKDIFTMLSLDLQYHGWDDRKLDWNRIAHFILASLMNSSKSELIKKYLPQIKARSKCTTLNAQCDTTIGKFLANVFELDYKQYRNLKKNGTAHHWQQLISQKKFNRLDFDKIHGRALNLLVKSKFLKNQGLSERYNEWIGGKVKREESVKFTGFVHELGAQIRNADQNMLETIDQQFQALFEKAGKITDYLVVKDTSGSMNSLVVGTNFNSYDVAKSLCIMIGMMLREPFHKCYIDFASRAVGRKYDGNTFTQMWKSEKRIDSADTNLQSVAHLLCDIRKTVSEDQFPRGLIVISDGQFNWVTRDRTNVLVFLDTLRTSFSKEFVDNFKFVFWDIRNSFYGHQKTKFETYQEGNVVYFSGFDPSVLSFLSTGKLGNPYMEALTQEIMTYVSF